MKETNYVETVDHLLTKIKISVPNVSFLMRKVLFGPWNLMEPWERKEMELKFGFVPK